MMQEGVDLGQVDLRTLPTPSPTLNLLNKPSPSLPTGAEPVEVTPIPPVLPKPLVPFLLP
jgi:hypothetical protein